MYINKTILTLESQFGPHWMCNYHFCRVKKREEDEKNLQKYVHFILGNNIIIFSEKIFYFIEPFSYRTPYDDKKLLNFAILQITVKLRWIIFNIKHLQLI